MSMQQPASHSAGQTTAGENHHAEYVAFLHRVPFALDAYRLGFATGVREDYRLRQHTVDNVDLQISMLDNDFRNPDRERYAHRVREYEPDVGFVGDTDDADEMRDLVAFAQDLADDVASFRPGVVPKSAEALDVVPESMLVGYARGYSDIKAHEFSTPSDWAGRDVHILGGTPPKQWAVIRKLTGIGDGKQESLTAYTGLQFDPANIVGVDWNGLHRMAMLGERWCHHKPHWRSADELTIRKTVEEGLREIRRYWSLRGVWPSTSPWDDHGPAVGDDHPRDWVCANCGCDFYRCDQEGLDAPWNIEEFDGSQRAFCSESCLDRYVYRTGAYRSM